MTAAPRLNNVWCALLVTLATSGLGACGGRIEGSANQQPDAQPIAKENLIASLEKAICGAGAHCCNMASKPNQNDCGAAVHEVWQPKLDFAAKIGAKYDPSAAARCVRQTHLEWEQCQDSKTYTSSADLICDAIFTAPEPRKSPGQMCAFSMECAGAGDVAGHAIAKCIEVLGPTTSGKLCRSLLISERDQACGDAVGNYFAICKAPLVCGTDNYCHPRRKRDEFCGDFTADACEPGSVCDANTMTCMAASPIGSQCAATDNRCEHSNCVNGRCAPYPDLWIDLYCP